MKTLFYMGRNAKTKGGVSWKIWKVERVGRRVLTYWGAAKLVRRKVVPVGRLQSNVDRTPPFGSTAIAIAYMKRRILRKLAKGYESVPRKRA